MTSQAQPEQTPIEQPEPGVDISTLPPAEKPLHALDDLSEAEYRVIMAFRDRPEPEAIPADYVFPHSKNYASILVLSYDPYSPNFDIVYPKMMYQNEFKVSHSVAQAAVEKIYADEMRAPEGDEIKLIRAVRHGSIDYAREILTVMSEQYPPGPLDEPPHDMLNVGEQIAFAVVGQLALEGTIERTHLEDSDYLTSFIMDIAEGINHALPQVDHVTVDRMFAARRAARRK